VEWLGQFVVWVIVIIAAVLVVIWEYSFPPNVHHKVVADDTVTHARTHPPTHTHTHTHTHTFL